MKETIIEEVIVKEAKDFGTSSHIILPKRHKGKEIYVLVVNPSVPTPYIHKDQAKEHEGEMYLKAEITTNAGTHSFWLKKKKIPSIFTRN